MTTEDISNLVKTVSRWSEKNIGQGIGNDFELDTEINLPEGDN